jgi:hypothetical protein
MVVVTTQVVAKIDEDENFTFTVAEEARKDFFGSSDHYDCAVSARRH